MIIKKAYLGDAVYAYYDGYQIRLTTENGVSTSNEIFLDREVVTALLAFILKIKE